MSNTQEGDHWDWVLKIMQAEIITIGTELLLGQIVDTNAAYLAQQLAAIGVNVYRKTTVGDNELRIAEAVRSALRRSDVVITTGGLGPTVDDRTREAVALATNRKLVLSAELLLEIEAFFARRGRKMAQNNRRQAYLPRNARPIRNPVGTAPGFIVKHQDSYVISLPGVPRELRYLMEHEVIPFLGKTFGRQAVIRSRILRTAGMAESDIDRLIAGLEESANPTVGLAAHAGQVDIRITARAEDGEDVERMLDEMEAQVRQRLGDRIYGADEETIEEVVARLLAARGLTLAVLETNTGGMVASRLTAAPHGVEVLREATVLPTHRVLALIPIPSTDVSVVSAETAQALAQSYRGQTGADLALALVGDMDPEVGPYSKRTGDTYIGLGSRDQTTSRHLRVGGVSEVARAWATNGALDMMRKFVLGTLR